jgi:hypothetical protein
MVIILQWKWFKKILRKELINKEISYYIKKNKVYIVLDLGQLVTY